MNSNESSLTIRDILNIATDYLKKKGIDNPRLTAEILLSFTLSVEIQELYINYYKKLDKRAFKDYCSVLKRRIKGEPVSYITGKKEFWSLEFDVNPSVLIPRPETETLVEHALMVIKDIKNPHILDLGTGSGVIAIVMAKEITDAKIWATDISDKAIEVAIHNAKKHGVLSKITFLKGNLWEPLKYKNFKFHLIVTNPPYIAEEDFGQLPPEVRDWEPTIALNGGSQGLSVIKKIIKEAHKFLMSDGWILIEISPKQMEKVTELFKKTGQYSFIEAIKDYSNKFRVIKARKR